MNFALILLLEIKAVAVRECQLIWQDSKLRSLVLLAPLLNAILICGVYAPSFVTEIPFAVVQQDSSVLSRRMIRWFDQSQKLSLVEVVSEIQAAEALFAAGKISGYLVFEKDFSLRIKQNQEARILLVNDASNLVLANTLASAVQAVTQTFNSGLAMQKARRLGAFKEQAQALVVPIRADIRSVGNPSSSYADFMLPGMLLTVLQQVILLSLALAWAGGKEAGSWPNLLAVSRHPLALLLGKNLPYIVINMLWLALYCGVLLPLSEVSSAADWSSLLLFSMLFVSIMVSWGTWVSILIGDRLAATQALMFVAVPSFILSGYTWPSSALPGPLQILSQVLPLTHSATMFRKIYGSGVGLSIFSLDTQVLLLFAAVHGALAWWLLRRLVNRNNELQKSNQKPEYS